MVGGGGRHFRLEGKGGHERWVRALRLLLRPYILGPKYHFAN